MGNAVFAERVKAVREKKGLFSTKLAEKLGIQKTRVSMWETNGNNPRNSKIHAIQRLLNNLNDGELDKVENVLYAIFDRTF